jgi:hypothetical protein
MREKIISSHLIYCELVPEPFKRVSFFMSSFLRFIVSRHDISLDSLL